MPNCLGNSSHVPKLDANLDGLLLAELTAFIISSFEASRTPLSVTDIEVGLIRIKA